MHELGREAFTERVWQWREQYGAHDRRAVQAARRVARLRRRAVHDGRAVRAGRAARVRARCTRRATSTATTTWSTGIPACARRSRTSRSSSAPSRTRSTRSTTRSRVGSGSLTIATVRPETMLADTAIAVHPAGRALHAADRRARDPAARRPAAADHRRRLRRPGVRNRSAQDHARPRPQRLRDRPRARPGGGHRDRRGRADDRGARASASRACTSTRRATRWSPRCGPRA